MTITVEDREKLLALLAREEREVVPGIREAAQLGRLELAEAGKARVEWCRRMTAGLSEPGGTIGLPTRPVGEVE